jgi:phosphate uptake regulator
MLVETQGGMAPPGQSRPVTWPCDDCDDEAKMMAQTAGPDDQLPDAIGRLAGDTTEMGIVVSDMFRYACHDLFGLIPETARFIAESQHWVAYSTNVLEQQARSTILQYHPTGDDLRRIVELQHAASQYGRIAERSSHIAEQAHALGGESEQTLGRLALNTSDIFNQLIALVYEQMRGAFLVTAARDLAQARILLEREAEVASYYNVIQARLKHHTRIEPNTALPLQRLIMVTTDMREIVASVAAICNAVLH